MQSMSVDDLKAQRKKRQVVVGAVASHPKPLSFVNPYPHRFICGP